ncbi:MAG: glutamate--tRNA ligase [Deltaproteobacteria bacterium]|nr:glutamate--tRNA ligase [Deltaproteobacteria bacterium]
MSNSGTIGDRPVRLHRGISRTNPDIQPKRGRPVEPAPRALTLEEISKLAGGAKQPAKVIRTRFAPSPTGHLHIGGGRTALMNFLFAKRMGGEFVLRIEDTDHLRSKPEYTEAIKDGLHWLGIEWKGDIVFQSRRTELYRRKIQELVDQKKAYRDETGAIFFKMPVDGELIVEDRVKGRVVVPVSVEQGTKDFVIQRSEGSPTFLLANVVDDGEMEITHVIRGDDHLTNAARQICLFRALGYPVPEFYHVPLIHGDDGAKLSKRHGATSVIEYQKLGYDPTVVVNHLARLGMSFGTDLTLPVEELAQCCDPYKFSKAPSRLGVDRLEARNMHHLKRMEPAALIAELEARTRGETVSVRIPRVHIKPDGEKWIESSVGEAPNLLRDLGATGLAALADAARGRVTTFMEAVELGQFLRMPPAYDEVALKVHGGAKSAANADKLRGKLAGLPKNAWNLDGLEKALDAFNDENRVSYKAYGEAVRWMLTGSSHGVPLHHLFAILGREEALDRLQNWPRTVEDLRARAAAAPAMEVVHDAPAVELVQGDAEAIERPRNGPKLEIELPRAPVAIERPGDQEIIKNGAPIRLLTENELTFTRMGKLKKPGDKLGEIEVEGFRADLIPATVDATGMHPEAAQKARNLLTWADLNDKGRSHYLEAHKAANGAYPAIRPAPGGKLATVEYGEEGTIRWTSGTLTSVGRTEALMKQHGWGPVTTSFVRGDPVEVCEQQVAWLRNANLYMLIAGLEARGAKGNGEEFWRFAVSEQTLPTEENLAIALKVLNGANPKRTAFADNLQVSVHAGKENRAVVETRGGHEVEKARVLDSLMNGLANGIWGSFLERHGQGEFALPTLEAREAQPGLPAAFEALVAQQIAKHPELRLAADAAKQIAAYVGSAQFYAAEAPERRLNGFDQRACLPFLEFDRLPWLTPDDKARVAGATTQLLAQLAQLSRPGAYQGLPKEQLGLQITQLMVAWAQQAQLAEPFGRWLDGPVRRSFFEPDEK